MAGGHPGHGHQNGWGAAALAIAVVALVIGFVPIAGDLAALPLSIAAVSLGGVGLLRAEDDRATNPGVCLAGILVGFMAGLLSFLTLVTVLTS